MRHKADIEGRRKRKKGRRNREEGTEKGCIWCACKYICIGSGIPAVNI
ncbi:MAG: hypothetical protein LH628_27980 [Microcoleus sp. CAN_BIN18]|nr:hypothetical protein [Microcoleus sp. CAN_BIN18]